MSNETVTQRHNACQASYNVIMYNDYQHSLHSFLLSLH
jgi:hypothetical protein